MNTISEDKIKKIIENLEVIEEQEIEPYKSSITNALSLIKRYEQLKKENALLKKALKTYTPELIDELEDLRKVKQRIKDRLKDNGRK